MQRLGVLRSLLCRGGLDARIPMQHHRKLVLATTTATKRQVFVNEKVLAVLCSKQAVRFSHLSSMIDRGAYDERFFEMMSQFQHTKGSDVKGLSVISDGKYHSLWLRSTCYCPQCRLDSTGQSSVDYDKVPEDSRVVSAVDDGWEGMLGGAVERGSGPHWVVPPEPVIPRIPYEDVTKGRDGVYRWVQALNEPGIAIVEGVPCQEGMVMCQKIADLIQHTIYGETFDVKTDARPINAAYSSGELKLHMDQPQYESPPGIQALHCLKFDENISGGDNQFVDIFHVAQTFREEHPDDFEVLCEVPFMYETLHYKRDWPVHMRYKRPILSLNDNGDLVGIRWHPQLMGPLQIEEEYIEPFFRAYKKFYSLTQTFPYMYRNRLRAGELVSFNNRRVLHGRAAFDNHAGERFLQGCYIEISEFKSCVEVLCNVEGGGRPVVRVGDMDWQ
ncbi:hypothetical protein BaRGS_00003985 [Batillaria attramentaria]|uniref:TauD/TfdA-like domain-containing protein n=1 Tax=Batillaria attramentaria TaxID=370345 RepID=A0ABD0M163_9CAEN